MTTRILIGDVNKRIGELADESVHCVITSPPYWGLRDYGVNGQLGLEKTPDEHVGRMVAIFREVWRVLRQDGTLWLNYGDSYCGTPPGNDQPDHSGNKKLGTRGLQGSSRRAQRTSPRGIPTGLKVKDLVGMPWRVAFALQADGWYLRSDIIWHKPNPMPESVTDRPTKSHEYVFLFAKSQRYYYDAEAVREVSSFDPGFRGRAFTSPRAQAMGRKPSGNEKHGWVTESGYRNLRDVWMIPTASFPGAHFATFPPKLAETCIKAGSPEKGMVLDPFGGAGTVGLVADRLGRDSILIELNENYASMARKRIHGDCPMFAKVDCE